MLNKKYMEIALDEARRCTVDIPVAALIVKDGKIIALQSNRREKDNRVIAHAEILALDEANKKLNCWRLDGCDMYVTLEPCPMCGWAIINSKIKNLYFGAWDVQYGAFCGALNLKTLANSKINVTGGVMEDECQKILDNYFRELRNGKSEKKA